MSRHQLGSLAASHRVFTCDRCEATECGSIGYLRDRGWIVHRSRPTAPVWVLVLCRDCEPVPDLFNFKPSKE